MPIGKAARTAMIVLSAFALAIACACSSEPGWQDEDFEAPEESFAPGFEAVHAEALGSAQAAEPEPIELPAYFDLRDRGVVTPVKAQNPWGTCWAFSAIAAAETSILSDEGLTYGETGLDLSELHLAWFPFIAITASENESQIGEGLYLVEGSDANAPLRDGAGFGPMITALFASGGGPVSEEEFPYRGSAGMTQYEFYVAHPDEAMALTKEEIELAYDMSYEEYVAENYPNTDPDEALKLEYEAYTEYYRTEDCYSSEDDWSVPEVNDSGQSNRLTTSGWELSDANYLPQLGEHDNAGNWTGLSETGMRAAKEQLLAGRGIAVCLAADQARPEDWEPGIYMNTDTWAHYTFEDVPINHEVCIVGWDDSYSSSNFNYGAEPPGDGAWIAKNSWGSETERSATEEAGDVGRSPWGVLDENGNHTGYFYISYYDKSLTDPVTFEFDAAQDANNDFVEQHDYLPGIAGIYQLYSSSEINTANVFTAQADEEIYAVSTITPTEDVHVRFDVRILNDGATEPDDGELAASIWERFDYEGFHRIELPTPVAVKKGQRFSVTCTAFELDEDGHRNYIANAGMDDSWQDGSDSEPANGEDPQMYAVAVVNDGESFLFDGESWQDWASYIAELGDSYADTEIDNFSIKAYARTIG